jgi:uncharacterized protein with FMN-binding domain
MPRVVPAVILTIIGLIALATFKSTAPASSHAAPALKSHASRAPAGTAPPATAPPPASTGPRTSPPTAATTSHTYDGDPVDNQYGTVQVRITVQGRRITAIDPLQMPYDRSRSQYISEQAAPYLHDEVLQAQSAQIDIVSGATYTSESYIQSLQSALDKAHI